MLKNTKDLAFYTYVDLGQTSRLHYWGSGKWAVGNGPIRYISEEEAIKILEENNIPFKLPPNHKK